MIVFPNAKINIGLNVISRRTDGYHNLETVFYPVKIKDGLEVIESDKFAFTSTGIEIPGYANENLCVKALELIRQDYSVPELAIHLHKAIPIGAGLGGGSADAAFFIKLLDQKFNLGLSMESMEDYARELGADCAFFIRNQSVFASGKGDEFTSTDLDLSRYYIILVMPPVHVSTGEAYRGVKPAIPSSSLKDLIRLPIDEWKGQIKNDFEESVFKNHPSIRGIKSALYEAGALYASMSGSGAAVYGIFQGPAKLADLEKKNQVFYGM